MGADGRGTGVEPEMCAGQPGTGAGQAWDVRGQLRDRHGMATGRLGTGAECARDERHVTEGEQAWSGFKSYRMFVEQS